MKDAVSRDNILVKAPINELSAEVNCGGLVSKSLSMQKINRFGVFVLEKHFDVGYISELAHTYKSLLTAGEIKRSESHKTEVRFRDDHIFSKIVENSDFLSLAKNFFNGSVGLDFMRIVKKDTVDRDPVFLHQDAGYQVGRFDAYSFFIPLTKCGPDNGGLALYPGTCNFGYLGDVGGIASILPVDYPVIQPVLDPGDVLIMHAGTWHYSTPNISGEDRVYLEVNIRAAEDPATKKMIDKEDKRDWILKISVNDLFDSSREQRIKSLYREIAALKSVVISSKNET